MNFIKRIFSRPKKEETFSFTYNMFGKERTVIVDIGEEARKRYAKEYAELKKSAWQGKNEVGRIRENGYIVYKSNWVTVAERELVGFDGLKWFSKNSKFCIVFITKQKNEHEFNLVLVDTESKSIVYRKSLQRPSRCRVSNTGIVVCEDWEGYDSPACSLHVINARGRTMIKREHSTGLGEIFEFIENETMFKYNINSTREIHIMDLY